MVQQLTKEQAIEFANSKIWEDWTDDQIVKFQLFQDKLCMDFGRFHKAVEVCLGRPVFTHEFGRNYDGIVNEFLGNKPKPTLDEIIELIPAEKRIVLGI